MNDKPATKMKRVRITLEVDTESGDYEMWYNNLDYPGEKIDYTFTLAVLSKIFSDRTARIGTVGEA